MQDGITPILFNYKGFKDTALAETIMPFSSFCQNTTIANGVFSDPAIWSKGRVPLSCDELTIKHNVQVDTSMTVQAIEIESGATLTIMNAKTLILGQIDDDGSTNILNHGSLIISGGILDVIGRVKSFPGSSFSMPSGNLKIRGNPAFEL
jgi:hypothetical protein